MQGEDREDDRAGGKEMKTIEIDDITHEEWRTGYKKRKAAKKVENWNVESLKKKNRAVVQVCIV